ncbi:MAG TPA: DM13 domain-containing protein [Acidimicrobiales bacterium]|nr:DM13 domain-containing protein [Acidimicrobiales bacterium]
MRRFGWKGGVAAVVVLGALAAVAFGYFGVHKLWTDDEVNEAAPVFESQEQAETGGGAGTTEDGDAAEEPTVQTEAQGSFVSLDHPTSGTATVLGDGSGQRFLRFTGFETDNGPDLNVYLSTTPPDGDESTFDDDFVDLGDLRGNVGDQNYEIPTDVDLSRHHTVVIWCGRFSVPFGAAQLA